jgi:hypothetical protein
VKSEGRDEEGNVVVPWVIQPHLDPDPVAEMRPLGEVGLQVEADLIESGNQSLRESKPAVSVCRSLQCEASRRPELDWNAGHRHPGRGVEDVRRKRD